MNKLKTLAIMLGLFSGMAFAQQASSTIQPDSLVTQPTVVTSTITNPNMVNINNASAAEIQDKLVGIGAKKAQAIVDYRTKNGAFSSIEQLKEVSGIGSATLDKNRERIVLQ